MRDEGWVLQDPWLLGEVPTCTFGGVPSFSCAFGGPIRSVGDATAICTPRVEPEQPEGCSRPQGNPALPWCTIYAFF